MSKPFTVIHMDWLGSQRHKVAFDDEAGIFISEEVRRASRRLLARC
jgi:hypothetical protein